MSDPKFIRNKEPHQVSMPEGSRVAASKSADVGGPSVRNTLLDEEHIVAEEIDPLLNLSVELPEVVRKIAEIDLQKKNIISQVSIAENLPRYVSQPSFSTEYIEAEMNFPARLIHLKIENDKVKSEILELENLMSSGI
jgi:glutaredoxin-related protein